ncbi:MAG: hypothetical protein HY919_07435 [Elusimicrobia bacterium]|nr:hypothetical protein [Elusimicrobiota bacterium]
MISKTEFVKYLTQTTRIRHHHLQLKNQVVEFMVQLETEIKNKWYPVVRYDTKHGFAHKDVIHYNGTMEKFNLGMSNYNIAMTFAEQDLKSNWTKYKEQFCKEVQNDR